MFTAPHTPSEQPLPPKSLMCKLATCALPPPPSWPILAAPPPHSPHVPFSSPSSWQRGGCGPLRSLVQFPVCLRAPRLEPPHTPPMHTALLVTHSPTGLLQALLPPQQTHVKGGMGGGGWVLKRKQVLKLGSLNGAYFYLNFKRQDFSSGIDFQGIYHPPLAHRVKKENEATQRFLPSRYSMQACKRKK